MLTVSFTGAVRYFVTVDGVDLEGWHSFDREALERANNLALANPGKVFNVRPEGVVRVEAKDSTAPVAPPPPPPPAPSSEVLWQWDATKVAPFGIHAKPAADWGDNPRVTLVNVGGMPGVRLLTMPGDDHLYGSNDWERSDLRLGNAETDASEGKEQWWSFLHWIPDDYAELPPSPLVPPPWYSGLLMDFHNSADKGGQANAQLMAMPPTATDSGRPIGLHFQVSGGDPAKPTMGQYPIGPIVRNVRLPFVYHVIWSATNNGLIEGWLDGRQFMKHVGPTLYTGEGAYLKLANYHSAIGKPSAVIHGRVIRAQTLAGLA
jgi:hypothetical protein